MHVVIATDGSKQSLAAARHLMSFADPAKIEVVTVVAVIRPLAAVPFADEVTASERRSAAAEQGSFRAAAENAVATVADVLQGWGPKVNRRVRSGSPATEILKLAAQVDAGLVVVASGGRGLSETVLIGSTAQRVQQYAACPVLVVRPAPRARRGAGPGAKKPTKKSATKSKAKAAAKAAGKAVRA